MKHTWVKRLKTSLEFELKINKIYKCINCGLLKGNHGLTGNGYKKSSFPTLYYFTKDGILSKNKLPYECEGSVFIKEEEFKL